MDATLNALHAAMLAPGSLGTSPVPPDSEPRESSSESLPVAVAPPVP